MNPWQLSGSGNSPDMVEQSTLLVISGAVVVGDGMEGVEDGVDVVDNADVMADEMAVDMAVDKAVDKDVVGEDVDDVGRDEHSSPPLLVPVSMYCPSGIPETCTSTFLLTEDTLSLNVLPRTIPPGLQNMKFSHFFISFHPAPESRYIPCTGISFKTG